MRRPFHSRLWLIALLPWMLALVPRAQAADTLCFSQTGHCISDRFRQYWEQNGGLPVFGYPISDAANEANRDTGQSYLTQWFERTRFELHADQAAPYDVLLGRLGDEGLQRHGRNWQAEPAERGPRAGCLWFPLTHHNICDQATNAGIKTYWQTHGLRDPRLNAYGRSLALFGYPLTTAKIETNSSGDKVLTQWFERARIEWHPGNPNPYKVLLGRLGAETYNPGAGGSIRTKLFFIALNDNGKSGKLVGCGDSVVPVEIMIPPTTAPLTASLRALLAIKTSTYGQSGLYNALYRSSLQVDSVSITAGKATIKLVGTISLGGECDDPRFVAQLTETALQFSTVNDVALFLNGEPLVLGGR